MVYVKRSRHETWKMSISIHYSTGHSAWRRVVRLQDEVERETTEC